MNRIESRLPVMLPLAFLAACVAMAAPCGNPAIAATKAAVHSSAGASTASSQDTVRIAERDLLCPTHNERARELYNVGCILRDQGELDAAKRSFMSAIELDSNYCDAMDNLGQLLRSQGDVDGAISWYKKSIKIQPSNKVAHQNLAMAYRMQGRQDDALAEYRTLVQLDAEDPEGYFGLGSVYFDMEKHEQAITQLTKAEELYVRSASPYVADARYYLGLCYFSLKNYGKSRDYLEPLYPTFKSNRALNYALGVCYLSPGLKNLERAREYLYKARALGMDIPPDKLRMLGE